MSRSALESRVLTHVASYTGISLIELATTTHAATAPPVVTFERPDIVITTIDQGGERS